MKLGKISAAILFALMLTMVFTLPAKASQGTRTDGLVIRYYTSVEDAYSALTSGTVDAVMYELSTDQVVNAQHNPNVVLDPVADLGFYEFDLNNNYTIKDARGYTSPMSYLEMREAVAFLSDKNLIVSTFCGGFAERIDQMIASPLKGWANASYWYPNYPYEYNPLGAKAALDAKFPEGAHVNPDYDPLFPGSAQHIRTYPADNAKAGQDLDPLIFCVRTDDSRRRQAGDLITADMKKMGVPINALRNTKSALYDRVMGDFNYHLYTGGWSVGRFPGTSLFGLYHSDFYFPYGQNYVVGIKQHVPKYPLLDTYLYNANYALTYSQAITNCRNAAGLMTILCVNVPLWSTVGFWCHSTKLLGVANVEGTGPTNGWTLLNAYKTDGSAITWDQISPPNTLNEVYSNWVYDYNTLDRMNLYGGNDVPPYNLAADQPGYVRDWTVGTWDDHGQTHTKVTMTLRSGDYFAKPVTGNQGENVNASCYFFNAWYDMQVGNGWFSSAFIDLDHVVITGTYSFEIYFNTASYFNLYYCQGPFRPMDTWAAHTELVTKQTESFVEGTSATTPGYITLTKNPIWIEYVKDNGAKLTPFTDYNIDADTKGQPGKLNIFAAIPNGHTIEVKYWAIGDPRGYTPGNLPWATALEGAGEYYMTDFSQFDYAVMKKNPFYYCETPLLGDIDFVKTGGVYKVDIFDLVLAAGAFGSQGTGVPSSNWFPGGDLAPPGGVVDIYDEVTVTGHYGETYDPPT